MRKRDYGDYVQDIYDSIGDIGKFINGVDFGKFKEDRKTINAVIRSIEVIGEAVKNIPHGLRNKYPNIPWKKMAGMRDKLVHEYFGVDLEIVWEVATIEIPELKSKFNKILKEI